MSKYLNKKIKVAIVIGHNAKAKGAYASAPLDEYEFDYNDKVATKMIELASESNIKLKKFYRKYRNSYSMEIKEVYDNLTDWGADISIELHFNSFENKNANGTEILSSGSKGSLRLANKLQKSMLSKLQLKDRGVKIIRKGDRGYLSLVVAPIPSVIVEPFFASNPKNMKRMAKIGIDGLAKAYLNGLIKYSRKAKKKQKNEHKFLVDVGIHTKGLSKLDFYNTNLDAITSIIDAVNSKLENNSHGELVSRLSLLEVITVMHCEMGITNGKVDPNFVHSSKERGLFPLPENIKYWNGSDSPAPNQKISVERNLKEFILYLGNLKNKNTGKSFYNGYLYQDLFNIDNYRDNEKIQAYLLAAVVHGWYYTGNYENRNIPYSILTDKIVHIDSDKKGLITLLEEIGYVHARGGDTSIVENRLANIEQAIDIANKLEKR